MRQCNPKVSFELTLIQYAVGWSHSFRGVLITAYGTKPTMIAHIMADCFGKVIPRAYAFVSEVIGTLMPTSYILVKDGYQEKSQVTSVGRRPNLVKYDTELLSLLHQPTHCLHKVRPIGHDSPYVVLPPPQGAWFAHTHSGGRGFRLR